MLMRSFTRREKVLLVILALIVLVGFYVLAVHQPVEAKLEALALEKENVELQLEVATIRLGQYQSMKAELDEIFAMPKDQITVMPPYDNIESLMVQLNIIFQGLEPNLRFPDKTFHEGVAARPIQFTFQAPSYAEAKIILRNLTRTGNRSLLDSLAITPVDRDGNRREGYSGNILAGPQSISGTITFYELAPQTLQADENDGG